MEAVSLGKVSSKLEEASGLVASISNPGYLWTINDSGNPSEIFLIDSDGDIKLTCQLKKIHNRDWEDIALGRDPKDSLVYLYVGEIGDNEAKYDFKYIYRLKEPFYEKDDRISIDKFDTLIIKLPDALRDMEAMAIDHSTGDLYMVSKREQNVTVYLLDYNSTLQHDTLVPTIVNTIPYFNTVAMDFSFDSKEILLKTYDEIYYWKKSDTVSIAQTLSSPPIKLDYKKEPQGESIAWNLDGSGFYTLSESTNHARARLYYYKKAK
ncbi:MAG TPA: hypothetical protein VIS49_12505 [Cyclobacteriaceae bacterium]